MGRQKFFFDQFPKFVEELNVCSEWFLGDVNKGVLMSPAEDIVYQNSLFKEIVHLDNY